MGLHTLRVLHPAVWTQIWYLFCCENGPDKDFSICFTCHKGEFDLTSLPSSWVLHTSKKHWVFPFPVPWSCIPWRDEKSATSLQQALGWSLARLLKSSLRRASLLKAGMEQELSRFWTKHLVQGCPEFKPKFKYSLPVTSADPVLCYFALQKQKGVWLLSNEVCQKEKKSSSLASIIFLFFLSLWLLYK